MQAASYLSPYSAWYRNVMTRSSRLTSETKWFRFLSGKFLEILVWRTTEHKYSTWLMDRGAQALHLVDGPWNTSMAFCWRTVEHKYGILLSSFESIEPFHRFSLRVSRARSHQLLFSKLIEMAACHSLG